ncbi:hypothetical protein SOCEGT47_075990 [Sorangium cellulosum]|uniref:Uncharacterized protein n=1 Tax=Sorangium cellulosum TaxID=56 RepID=A0A4P2QCH7_SORCE|nr:DUF1592 domain-containing protein [Sorangium cellulosum]AUX27026.1 hypothetical protein SOCEGT47_075990 [Sorangium cellulosum]
MTPPSFSITGLPRCRRGLGAGLCVTVLLLAGCTGSLGDLDLEGSEDPVPGGSGPATGGVARGIDMPGAPQYHRFVRLTNSQWASSVQVVLNLAAPSSLSDAFEKPVAGTTDFTNNELLLSVNQRSWGDYQSAAEALAEEVTASDASLAKVYPDTDAAGFIKTVGRRAYRRPLTDAEVAKYTALFETGAAMSGTKSTFAKGAQLVIRTMLQSPHFLYRTELGEDRRPLDGYEIAAKLSLWLRNAAPDDALLDEAPTLTTPGAIAAVAESMLEEPAAALRMRHFHSELLHFDRYATISKVGVRDYDESLNAEYEESAYLFFEKIFTEGLGVKDILTSTRGFVGPGMASLYGLEPIRSGFAERDLGPDRVGFFSQLPYLTLNALNAESDAIHRGVSINLDVLCTPLGAPVPNLPQLPPLEPGQTNRERITRLTSPCGGVCHNELINPVGFAFEHFDGMGQYRDEENGGLPIDSSGVYSFSEGAKSFADAGELMRHMAEGEQAHLCYAKKLASFALQRDVVPSDLPLVETLAGLSRGASGSVKEMMLELVKHEAFRTRVGGPL